MKLLNGHRLLVQDLHSWFLYQASISAGKIFNSAVVAFPDASRLWWVCASRG